MESLRGRRYMLLTLVLLAAYLVFCAWTQMQD